MILLRKRPLRSALKLPSITGAFTITEVDSAGGHRFAVISNGRYHCVLLQCWVDPAIETSTIAADWIDLWGSGVRVEATNRDLMCLTATLDFAPESSTTFTDWCAGENVDGYNEIVTGFVALTFQLGKGHGAADSPEVILGIRLRAVIDSLHKATGLRTVPLTQQDVAAHLTQRYAPLTGTTPEAWSRIVPSGTEETRHHLAHPDGTKTVSWIITGSPLDTPDSALFRAMTRPISPRRAVSMTLRRTHDETSPILRTQICTLTSSIPLGVAPNIMPIIGEHADELNVSERVSIRRGYDRQGELAAITAGIGVVVPEQAEIREHPVLRDDMSIVKESVA